jgi:hypothetical protein
VFDAYRHRLRIPDDQLLSIAELAERLAVDEETARKVLDAADIPTIRDGRHGDRIAVTATQLRQQERTIQDRLDDYLSTVEPWLKVSFGPVEPIDLAPYAYPPEWDFMVILAGAGLDPARDLRLSLDTVHVDAQGNRHSTNGTVYYPDASPQVIRPNGSLHHRAFGVSCGVDLRLVATATTRDGEPITSGAPVDPPCIPS